jgi:hypothetical protein
MTTTLFLDQDFKPEFKKTAMTVKLSDNADNWQREVASELFKQLPYLAEYSVNVILDKVDSRRGYALGSAEITNQTDAPLPDQPPQLVRVPLVVKDRMLMPLDIMIVEGQVWPLSERRLNEKLFRTDMFETSTRKPTDQGMVDQLYPPLRTNYGYGNSVATGAGVGGFGKQASLIELIAPTISDRQYNSTLEKIADSRDIGLMYERNKIFSGLMHKVASVSSPSVEKTAQALIQSIKPTVVQFTKMASGNFKVKWANANAFMPQEAQIDPNAAQKMVGEDLSKAQPGQTMTVSTERAKKETLDEPAAVPVTEFGNYAVKNADTGDTLVGTVIPVVDFEMQPLELFVFTDGEHYTAQDSIVGVRQKGPNMGALVTIQSSPQPQGDGVFVYTPQGDTKPFCTQPLTVLARSQGPDGSQQVQAIDLFGQQLVLHLTPGLVSFEEVGESEYAIPEDMHWLPLNGEPVHLLKEDQPDVHSDQKQLGGEVDIKSTGPDEVSLDGLPIAKLARDQKWFIKAADAEFLLVGMGMAQNEARAAIDKAQTTGSVKLAGLNSIRPLSDIHDEMTKKAAKLLEQYDYNFWSRDLIKEAAALEDSETADKILALNFLNPENLSIFASYLPQLDETSSRLAEMLLASRLGMNQVPEGAAERALKNLEEVIQGLKALQAKQLI